MRDSELREEKSSKVQWKEAKRSGKFRETARNFSQWHMIARHAFVYTHTHTYVHIPIVAHLLAPRPIECHSKSRWLTKIR